MTSRRGRHYPALSPFLKAQLLSVPPSGGKDVDMYPCQVTLSDGRVVDRVYVMEQERYITWWGVWPEDDKGKSSISIELITRIEDSPTRLPVALANELYDAGESGMGYCIFTLELRDRRRLPYVTGNALDWVDFPPDVTPADVVRVHPGEGREHFTGRHQAPHTQGAPYFWCLYSDPPD